jgi:hypothetical protein
LQQGRRETVLFFNLGGSRGNRYNPFQKGGDSLAQKETFDILLLIARPAAGKSEIIDYLKRADLAERVRRFHLGEFEEIDDFPMLWTWLEEDQILERMGYPRLHTSSNGDFAGYQMWDLLVERISLEYEKKLRNNPAYHDRFTAVIEFSRGKEHGGFQRAFDHLSQDVAARAAILYIDVSWEESLRKNRARFNPDRPDSILEHALSDEKLARLYKESDWEEISAGSPQFITIQNTQVPYVVFENEDDVTTGRGDPLGWRLEKRLGVLWQLYQKRGLIQPQGNEPK